jgi:hypothetical protein
VNKKLLLIAGIAGLISFAASFAAGWLTRPGPATASAESPPTTQTPPGSTPPGQAASSNPIPPPSPGSPAAIGESGAVVRSLTEQQLKDLIFEVREKIERYDRELLALAKEKERLETAQQTLMKDIEALNTLRTDLAASVADLKNEREMLRRTRVEVDQVEKTNLVAIAAAYDKMDAVRASEILTNMATAQANGSRTSSLDDAVKILHYMEDRTKASVLGEIVATEPALAALLSQKLKRVTEGN